MQYKDPRGPLRTIFAVEERSDAIVVTFTCGCVGRFVPHRRGAYRVGDDDVRAFNCQHKDGEVNLA